jgi:hypothetical protein
MRHMPTERLRELIAADPDAPVYGCRNIAVAANVLDENGEPAERRCFHMLMKGYLDADKIGGTWASTPRRLRRLASAQAA